MVSTIFLNMIAYLAILLLFVLAIRFYYYRNKFADFHYRIALDVRRNDKGRRIFLSTEKWHLFFASILYLTLMIGVLLALVPVILNILVEQSTQSLILESLGFAMMGMIIFGLTYAVPVSLVLWFIIILFGMERHIRDILILSFIVILGMTALLFISIVHVISIKTLPIFLLAYGVGSLVVILTVFLILPKSVPGDEGCCN